MKQIIVTGLLFAFMYFVAEMVAKAADLDYQYREHVYQQEPPTVVVPPLIVEAPQPRCSYERTTDHDAILGDEWVEHEVCE